MESDINGSLPFLNVLVSNKYDGSFSHQVFHNKMHTEQYLHVDSHHYPKKSLGVISTLDTRVL